MKNLDDKIRKALEDNIENNQHDKKDIWNNIEHKLFTENKREEQKKMKSNKKRYMPLVAAAAAVIIFVGTQTEIGHAIITQIKDMFVSQKEINQDIEGNKEKTDVNLQQPSESDYVIYVDEERYEFIEGVESDKIVMKNAPDGDFPEVSMEIQQIIDKSPEDVVRELEPGIKDAYETFYEPKQIDEPINGWSIRGLDGNEWDSPITQVYVVSNGQEGSFIITQRYFLEAEEGHGARFDQMVKEFYIVDESQGN